MEDFTRKVRRRPHGRALMEHLHRMSPELALAYDASPELYGARIVKVYDGHCVEPGETVPAGLREGGEIILCLTEESPYPYFNNSREI